MPRQRQRRRWRLISDSTTELDHEAQRIAQDEAFCAALTAAIKRGKERMPVAPRYADGFWPVRIYGIARRSYVGSSAASCAEASEG